ncbi:MAG: metallophosphoesterase, partial [Gemmatimonadota bacterium]
LAVGAAMWAVFYLGRAVGHGGSGTAAAALELVGMCWLAALFLTAVALLAVDVATGFGWLLPRYAPALRGWALAAGGVLTVVALFQGLRPPVVREYEVRLPGLPAEADGITVVALSDLHIGSLIGADWLAARVEQVEALQPDLIVLLGDLFEGHGEPLGAAQAALGRLGAPLGVWAVPGNHEGYGARGGADRTAEEGIEVLRNRWVEVRPGLTLAGVEDLTSRRRGGRGGEPIAAALEGHPLGAVTLLSHSPLEAEEAVRAGVGLMLSGHTHGGQIWPLGYLIQRHYPLLAGEYRVGGMTVLVTRGAGTWGPRMRLWHPGEILRVTLRRG